MALALVGGSTVVWSIVAQQVDAKLSEGYKKNRAPCKDKKSKKN
jgi:hypothetical protein